MSEPVFTLPTAPAGPWDQLTDNEKAWIEFIRVISGGRDPRITPKRVRALTVAVLAVWLTASSQDDRSPKGGTILRGP